MTAQEHAQRASTYARDGAHFGAIANALAALALVLTEQRREKSRHPHAREEQAYRDLYASHAEKRRREAHKAYGGTA